MQIAALSILGTESSLRVDAPQLDVAARVNALVARGRPVRDAVLDVLEARLDSQSSLRVVLSQEGLHVGSEQRAVDRQLEEALARKGHLRAHPGQHVFPVGQEQIVLRILEPVEHAVGMLQDRAAHVMELLDALYAESAVLQCQPKKTLQAVLQLERELSLVAGGLPGPVAELARGGSDEVVVGQSRAVLGSEA